MAIYKFMLNWPHAHKMSRTAHWHGTFKSFKTSGYRRSEGLSVYMHVDLYIQPFSTRIDDVIKLISIDQFSVRKHHPGIS